MTPRQAQRRKRHARIMRLLALRLNLAANQLDPPMVVHLPGVTAAQLARYQHVAAVIAQSN